MTPPESTSQYVEASELETPHFSRSFAGPVIPMLLVLLFIVVLLMDYSDIVFADSRRRAALDLIKPGMRLTQAERALNAAGYMTLYVDEHPPWLQVSSLDRWPFTAALLHRLLPNSAPDVWVRARLSGLTRFYVAGESYGAVKFSSDGRATFSPTWHGATLPGRAGDSY